MLLCATKVRWHFIGDRHPKLEEEHAGGFSVHSNYRRCKLGREIGQRALVGALRGSGWRGADELLHRLTVLD